MKDPATRIPRTWAEVKRHPAVDDVDFFPNEDVRYWIYLRDGFIACSDPLGRIHQGNGHTVREAIDDVFPVIVEREVSDAE